MLGRPRGWPGADRVGGGPLPAFPRGWGGPADGPAALVRADKIDILVDLSGHMGQPRLLAFARKPAPVQVTYIGHQNTTGMSAIAYPLTD